MQLLVIGLEVIVHCFHLYHKKPCLINLVSSCTKAFSHFYITVVHSEKILFCISQFVSSFSKPFWSILYASSFHCLFSRISLFFSSYFYSPWFFPSCCYFVCMLCISSLVFTSQSAANDLLFAPVFASVSSFCYVNVLKRCLKV